MVSVSSSLSDHDRQFREAETESGGTPLKLRLTLLISRRPDTITRHVEYKYLKGVHWSCTVADAQEAGAIRDLLEQLFATLAAEGLARVSARLS